MTTPTQGIKRVVIYSTCAAALSAIAGVANAHVCMKKPHAQGYMAPVHPHYIPGYSDPMRQYGYPPFHDRTPAYRKEFRDFLDAFEKKHPSVKDNIISFYLSEYGDAKASGKANQCKRCGEPAAGEECKACQIISHLKA